MNAQRGDFDAGMTNERVERTQERPPAALFGGVVATTLWDSSWWCPFISFVPMQAHNIMMCAAMVMGDVDAFSARACTASSHASHAAGFQATSIHTCARDIFSAGVMKTFDYCKQ